jgi:hypothetical protein
MRRKILQNNYFCINSFLIYVNGNFCLCFEMNKEYS